MLIFKIPKSNNPEEKKHFYILKTNPADATFLSSAEWSSQPQQAVCKAGRWGPSRKAKALSQLLEKSVLKSARFVVREENSLGLSFPKLQVNVTRIKEGNKN